MNLIECQTTECLSTSDFEDIIESTLVLLVKNDGLVIKDVNLFAAVMRWAVKECERREMDSNNGYNLRQVSECFN